MSPRPYTLGKRQAQIDEVRQQILDATRSLLAEPSAYAKFTLDAVARRADVARATVYYQFGSKAGLLEALCDHLAVAGGLAGMPEVFTTPEPAAAIRGLVSLFGRLWDADRVVMRRLRALALLDPDVGAVITARDERRLRALGVLVARLDADAGSQLDLVRALYTLSSFEFYDTIAAPGEALTEAIPQVLGVLDALLERTVPG
jgi:AcrR family transcriptional regulator